MARIADKPVMLGEHGKQVVAQLAAKLTVSLGRWVTEAEAVERAAEAMLREMEQ